MVAMDGFGRASAETISKMTSHSLTFVSGSTTSTAQPPPQATSKKDGGLVAARTESLVVMAAVVLTTIGFRLDIKQKPEPVRAH